MTDELAFQTMFCMEHVPQTREGVLTNLAVFRKVFVDRDENHLLAKLYQQGETGDLSMRIGSLLFHHIGQLLPHQLDDFHNKDFIYPVRMFAITVFLWICCHASWTIFLHVCWIVGYSVTRIYWSRKHLRRREQYHCSIADVNGKPQFYVTCKDPFLSEVVYQAPNATELWRDNILEPLQNRRLNSDLLKLFPMYISGENLFGFMELSVQKMIESVGSGFIDILYCCALHTRLPGVNKLLTYDFKNGRAPLMDLPLAVNPSCCARCEPRFRTYVKRSHMLNAHANHSIQSLLALSGLSTDALLCTFGGRQSLASKWSQYRKMKQEWQNNVYLARSKIQGLGLYAKRDIEMSVMIIEYIGEIIRNEVAERREKNYRERNRGIYMFRIDPERVIDATMAGGPARYINHSCDPNCVAELVQLDKESKIVIMSCRPISKGEELTYDYQFDFEDDENKIPCLCGAPNCRKWMN
ncbi:unnamed protein product [Soboliphyme baturini]|uniref:Histone-lysine N-methyltransferase n=1 Tax=Soboliphyme baturini TaxID=241478 RepID=A0A183IG88_9BILA|nr:unnamed protein product [Soboliphyme baturini]